jgi:VWFA-related protein
VGQTDQDKTQKNQSEYYEVDVTVQLLPVFAVDKKGNPVYDLKKQDIEFYVDGKPTEIVSFLASRMEVEEFTRPPAQGAETKKAPAPMRPTERINFIILDTLVSNAKIMEINKTIAAAIINKASAGDSYVIFQTNQAQGFRYVIGPEKDKMKLFQALRGIKVPYIRRDLRANVARRKRDYYASLGTHGERDSINTSLYILRAEREQEMYQRDIQRFAQAVRELKYALKTIRLPKTVFLISAGTKHYGLGISGATQYRLLEGAAKAVNFGGAMLYVVNPIMYRSENKRKALKFMADVSGGKLVHGANIREIVDTVQKSTAAFYELAFQPPAQSGTRNRISMKCKRKGVELISVNYSEKSTPYPKMNKAEKKLFALNVVNGGNWSRITAKVGKIRYKKLDIGTGNAAHTVEITLPTAMRNRPLDVFLVHIDPETQKADMTIEKKTITGKAILQLTPKENRNAYFVLIEPTTPFCIYNQVTL